MNIKSVFALLALTVLASACSTMKVTSERDQNFDFGKIQTYQWIDGPAEILDDVDIYINEDIQLALDAELASRGLRLVSDAAEADAQVAYYVKLKEELEYTEPANRDEREFSGGFVYSRESSSWNYEEREPDLNIYAFEIGTLTVLIYDTETSTRIWRGTLQTKIDRSRPEDEQQARIRTAAKKLMSRFLSTAE